MLLVGVYIYAYSDTHPTTGITSSDMSEEFYHPVGA